MRYLITTKNHDPFLTHWFDWENNYTEGMTIYDVKLWLYSIDGKNWKEIEFDHL